MDDLDWSIEMQERHALQYYEKFWKEPDIIEIDSLNVAGDNGDATDLAEQLDYSGSDKMVIDADTCFYLVPQRIRPDNSEFASKNEAYGADFSLRYMSKGSNAAELQKMKEAREKKYAVKHKLYAFGIADVDKSNYTDDDGNYINDGKERMQRRALERGFKYFAFYDIQSILDHYFDDPRIGKRTSNGDGTGGVFFKLKDIRDYEEWCWTKEEDVDLYHDEAQSGLQQF